LIRAPKPLLLKHFFVKCIQSNVLKHIERFNGLAQRRKDAEKREQGGEVDFFFPENRMIG